MECDLSWWLWLTVDARGVEFDRQSFKNRRDEDSKTNWCDSLLAKLILNLGVEFVVRDARIALE